jgi:hypothetical protein
MNLSLPSLLITTLLAGSAVAGLKVIAPSQAPASASSTQNLRTGPATSGKSEVLVFPANRFAASSAGLKPVPPRVVRLNPSPQITATSEAQIPTADKN